MLRRELLSTLAFANAASAKTNQAKPNILVIMPDQWRGIDLGCAGNAQVKTPNLDRLAKEGVHLADAVANCPVCTPARASLLTGKYPHSVASNEPGGMSVNDLPFDSNQPTLPKALAAAGYFTGFIGKWHLHGGPRLPGFVPPGPARLGFEWWAGNICSHAYTRQTYFRNEPNPIPISGYDTFAWTDLALEFLTTAAQRHQPWCLHLWYPTPHDPYLLPPGFEKFHDPAKIELRKNWIETPRNGSRRDIAGYYSAIACLDQQIGRVLANVPENTIVVFLSDHGDMLGSQGTLLKRKPWEESVRIPGIISWPDKIKPGVSHVPFSHVDVAPTLLGLAGLPALPKSQGFNYAPHLLGKPAKKALPDHAIILSYTRTESNEHAPWRGIRTRVWKYARFEDQPWVMYDLAADPFELDNLATRPEHAKKRTRFDRLIAAHMRRAHNLMIGDRTAEEVKIGVGSAMPLEEPLSMEVKGRDMVAGLPRTVLVSSTEMTQAMDQPLRAITDAVRGVLERTPPELASDIIDKGMVMSGGGALLRDMDRLLTQVTGVPCLVADNPLQSVAIGTGIALENFATFRKSLVSA